ncbi:hypothetical protein WA538_004990 [Blastocystis sp. DL]
MDVHTKRRILIIGDVALCRCVFLPSLLAWNGMKDVEFFLTDLSDSSMIHRIHELFYDFVLFFVDMKYLRSWTIVQNALSECSIDLVLQSACVVINSLKETWNHSFSLTSVIDVLDPNGIPYLPFSDDRVLQSDTIQSVNTLFHSQLPSSTESVFRQCSFRSFSRFVI